QISNVRDIANGMREATRYFVELSRLGATITHVDVGGGLGVDYEGTRSRSFCSINYGLQQYASTIVQPLADACAEHGLAPPRIVTECGRAMTAHHALLVTNVVEVEPAPEGRVPDQHDDEPSAIRYLREIHADLGKRPPVELYQEALHFHAEGLAAYALGQIDLVHRARIDDLFYAIAHGVRARLSWDEKSHRAVIDELDERLVDKYFVNFSVFESLPDVWAIDQVFPIVPISRLDERPDRRGVIADLTCDSDGKIDIYVEYEGLDSSLPGNTRRDPRTNRRHSRQDLHLRRERGPGLLAAAAPAAQGRELPAGVLPGRRLPGGPGRHPQPVRRHRRGRGAPGRRRLRDHPAAQGRHHRRDARLRRLQARRPAPHLPRAGRRSGPGQERGIAPERGARARADRLHLPRGIAARVGGGD